MKEILTIRALKSRITPHLNSYDRMNKNWIKDDSDFIIIIKGNLGDASFAGLVDHLRMNDGYNISHVKRTYSKAEIDEAKLFSLSIDATFEPTGEELGTKYEFPCNSCRIRRKLSGPLRINTSKVPKKADIAKSIALDEWIVNERFKDIIISEQLSGTSLEIVESTSRNKNNSNWYQFNIDNEVSVSSETRFGDAFKPDIDIKIVKTECGHEIRDLIYSEVFIDKKTWDGTDFCVTNYYFGGQAGVIYPFKYILISKKAFDCLVKYNLKGFSVEIAHLI